MLEHPYWHHDKLINVVEMSRVEFLVAMAPLVVAIARYGVDITLLNTQGEDSQLRFFLADDYVPLEEGEVPDWTLQECIEDNWRPGRPLYVFTLREIMAGATCFGIIPNRNYLVNW